METTPAVPIPQQPAAAVPPALKGRLPAPPSVKSFPPKEWPTPEERRSATIRAAREAGVPETDIATATGGCGKLPPYVWGALIALAIVIIYVVWLLFRGGRRHGGHDKRRYANVTDCTNWTSAGTSVSSVLPWCGDGAPGSSRPEILHGDVTAYTTGGKACYSEQITGDTIDGGEVNSISTRAYQACGSHPDAYIGEGAYLCSAPGGGTGTQNGDALACRQFVSGPKVRGTSAPTLDGGGPTGKESAVAGEAGLAYGNPTVGAARRRQMPIMP